MTPDELIAGLKRLGIDASRSTLARWARQKLIPAPHTRSLGRGRGAESQYPATALGEAAASALLLGFMRASQVASIRRMALLEWRPEDAGADGDEIPIEPLDRLPAAVAKRPDEQGLPQFIPEAATPWVALWVRVRDAVNRGESAALAAQGPLVLKKTQRGTYQLAARG